MSTSRIADSPNRWELSPDEYALVDSLVTEDDTPVDGIYSERQMRLLVSALYTSWTGPGNRRSFLALANVGLFSSPRKDPIVPDFLLSLDVVQGQDMGNKQNRCYFMWVHGKPPEVVIEIVSNTKGGEADTKLVAYANLGIKYYVIWDPEKHLKDDRLRVFCLEGSQYRSRSSTWLDEVGLGLKLWKGEFENLNQTWLRWCDKDGQLLLTGQESARQERELANEAKQRAEAEHQRAEQATRQAEQATRQAEQATRQAEAERLRAEQLAEKLRQLGFNPES